MLVRVAPGGRVRGELGESVDGSVGGVQVRSRVTNHQRLAAPRLILRYFRKCETRGILTRLCYHISQTNLSRRGNDTPDNEPTLGEIIPGTGNTKFTS